MSREQKIKDKAKELCEKSGCHHKCKEIDECVVMEEAEELLISQDKSNNFDVKSNNELFKQALVEGVNRHIDKTIEEEKKIEQIEEMAKIIYDNRPIPEIWQEDAEEIAHILYNAGYRKQSEGEWIDRYNGKYANSLYVCSVCDGRALLTTSLNELSTSTVKQILTPYCPHCGAKMKGGE